MLPALAALAILLGLFLVGLRAELDARRSINPHLHRYAPGLALACGGVVLLVYSAPCRHLSAWAIGIGVAIFSVGSKIWGLSLGYVIPELMRVVVALGSILVAMITLAVASPGC